MCFIINVLAQQLKHWGYGCEFFSKREPTSSPVIGSMCLRLSEVSLTEPSSKKTQRLRIVQYNTI